MLTIDNRIGVRVNPTPKHPPLKHARYPSQVTVCIAAICQDHGAPRILLCSDSRMSSGNYGSTDFIMKIHPLGRRWIAQASGRPSSELIERVKEWFKASGGFGAVHAVVSSV